jgi:CRP-like cAMP-binding protein
MSAEQPTARPLPGSAVTQAAIAPLLRSARKNGLFGMLNDLDAEIVFSICHFSFVEKDVQLFRVGDRADYLLFIADGRVNVWCEGIGHQTLHVGMASEGAVLGESAITLIGQRSASVSTASRCALGFLFHDDFSRLWGTHPETALRFLVMMFNEVTKRMHAMVKQLTVANQVQAAAKRSQELLSRVLFDRRIGAPRPAESGTPPAERRGKPRP